MGVTRSVDTALWADPKIENFTAEDKYFWLYCLTNQHNSLCGIATLSKRMMAYEIGYSVECVANLIQRFEQIHELIKYDNQNNELLILNWNKYNWTVSPQCKKGIEKVLKHVKTREFIDFITKKIEEKFPSKEEKIEEKVEQKTEEKEDRVSMGYAYLPVPVPVPVSNTNIDTKTSKSNNKFIKPKLDEIDSYCRERGNAIDAQRFIDYYESNGWKVGKNPMKDWKAAIRTWEQRDKESKQAVGNKKHGKVNDIDFKAVLEEYA